MDRDPRWNACLLLCGLKSISEALCVWLMIPSVLHLCMKSKKSLACFHIVDLKDQASTHSLILRSLVLQSMKARSAKITTVWLTERKDEYMHR